MTFDTKDKIILGIVSLLLIVVVVGAIYIKLQQTKNQKEITDLINQVAINQPTVKLDNETYKKLSQIQENLDSYIKYTDENLYKQLEKLNLDILNITNTQAIMQNQLFKIGNGNGGKTWQEDIKVGEVIRKKVTFDKEQGYFRLVGFTISDPSEASIELSQIKPLQITNILTKDDSGKYSAIVKFPEDFPMKVVNIDNRIDINKITEEYQEKWYNKFYLGGSVYASKNGLVIGPSAGYKISKVIVGPSVMVDTSTVMYFGFFANYNLGGK